MNEAAIAAARTDCTEVAQEHLVAALDRMLLGAPKTQEAGKGRAMAEERRRVLAYHEAGHALVSMLSRDVSDEVAQVSIVPHGGSSGHTTLLPKESQLESGLYSRRYLEARMEGTHVF